ncbi:MAG TPA: hypothetical protein VFP84_26695 [Kofleriaceae bacterium]|nr:hypothetical protein [Kofleriaceae bacterium]
MRVTTAAGVAVAAAGVIAAYWLVRGDDPPPAAPAPEAPAPIAKPTVAAPAQPTIAAAPAFAVCPALTQLPPWWQRSVYPGCPEPPVAIVQPAVGELAGRDTSRTAPDGPCLAAYDAFSGQISNDNVASYRGTGWTAMQTADGTAIQCQPDRGRWEPSLCTASGGAVKIERDPAGKVTGFASTTGGRAIGAPLHLRFADDGAVTDEDLGPLDRGEHIVTHYEYNASRQLVRERRTTVGADGQAKPGAESFDAAYRYADDGTLAERTLHLTRGEHVTYQFADGRLVQATRHVDGEPESELERMTVTYDEADGRLRDQFWQRVVDGTVHDEQNRQLHYQYPSDPQGCARAR